MLPRGCMCSIARSDNCTWPGNFSTGLRPLYHIHAQEYLLAFALLPRSRSSAVCTVVWSMLTNLLDKEKKNLCHRLTTVMILFFSNVWFISLSWSLLIDSTCLHNSHYFVCIMLNKSQNSDNAEQCPGVSWGDCSPSNTNSTLPTKAQGPTFIAVQVPENWLILWGSINELMLMNVSGLALSFPSLAGLSQIPRFTA